MTLLAVVATNITFRLAEGMPPGPEAVMMAGPAEAAEIDTPAVPRAFVSAGLPTIVPRVEAKLTSDPTTGAPAFVQLTERGVGKGGIVVDKGISVAAAGVVNVKLALLMVSA